MKPSAVLSSTALLLVATICVLWWLDVEFSYLLRPKGWKPPTSTDSRAKQTSGMEDGLGHETTAGIPNSLVWSEDAVREYAAKLNGSKLVVRNGVIVSVHARPPESGIWPEPLNAVQGVEPAEDGLVPVPIPLIPRSQLAIATVAFSLNSAKRAFTIVQSLRDNGCKIPNIVVILFPDRVLRNRTLTPEDVIGSSFASRFRKLNATMLIRDSLATGKYIRENGGTLLPLWMMQWSTLRVFEMTSFKRVLFLHYNTLVHTNVDYLLDLPGFSATYSTYCCDEDSPKYPSPDLWVLEPSTEIAKRISKLKLHRDPIRRKENEMTDWFYGPQDMVMALFLNVTTTNAQLRDARRAKWPERLGGFAGSQWNVLDSSFGVQIGECECAPARIPKQIRTSFLSCYPPTVAIPFQYETMDPSNPQSFLVPSELVKGATLPKCLEDHTLLYYSYYSRGRLHTHADT